MDLKISQDKNCGNSAGKFAETIVDILTHDRDTLFKFLTVDLRTPAHLDTIRRPQEVL